MPFHALLLVLSSIVPCAEHFLEEDDCLSSWCPKCGEGPGQSLLGGGDQTTQQALCTKHGGLLDHTGGHLIQT